jgi:hypothetical protein
MSRMNEFGNVLEAEDDPTALVGRFKKFWLEGANDPPDARQPDPNVGRPRGAARQSRNRIVLVVVVIVIENREIEDEDENEVEDEIPRRVRASWYSVSDGGFASL